MSRNGLLPAANVRSTTSQWLNTIEPEVAPSTYSHPAFVAYAAAHPRRTIPKFGPYLLLQTLDKGEFSRVKLGLHVQWGTEVAVKLIRRADSRVSVRQVEREIEVLKLLKHPNIVDLYDVIETDKYIGIILEYVPGENLLDHILARRYLREGKAAKFFSQFISGVWYIHQKGIVHGNLKLKNLLLDENGNIIITGLGFTSPSEHNNNDVTQLSLRQPCYAAPELVKSGGLDVGSAVDVWSCGVILYAMLAGYLPFGNEAASLDDTDLLHKHIVSTTLNFPQYVGEVAQNLLSVMLVHDPMRRTTLEGVVWHPWLAAYHTARADEMPNAFGRTLKELELAAMEKQYNKNLKRAAYLKQAANPGPSGQRQTQAQAQANVSGSVDRRPSAVSPPIVYRTPRRQSPPPEYVHNSYVDRSPMSPRDVPTEPSTPTQRANSRSTTRQPLPSSSQTPIQTYTQAAPSSYLPLTSVHATAMLATDDAGGSSLSSPPPKSPSTTANMMVSPSLKGVGGNWKDNATAVGGRVAGSKTPIPGPPPSWTEALIVKAHAMTVNGDTMNTKAKSAQLAPLPLPSPDSRHTSAVPSVEATVPLSEHDYSRLPEDHGVEWNVVLEEECLCDNCVASSRRSTDSADGPSKVHSLEGPTGAANMLSPSSFDSISISSCSVASSRTTSTDYGLYYTRWAISQDTIQE
ncbi:hypothetical protein GALMADRAFT_245664 [Galerina marginata CBS 339.88]|uniref:Protein kinase domain-containing protein n=1 Tax=Galerina marginata (strain CBS 339.88) TaxID=685588 RepID=A0A067T2W1_GALM3|nr:hypothetical protein GALMADRAFT_245664 [Galerina marginata CBS 339.88]